MKILKTVDELQQWRASCKPDTPVILVPTMGGLHQGHRALIEQAQNLSPTHHLIVSLFVNPLQFNDKQDLSQYPSSWDDDITLLKQLNVDAVFAPAPSFAPAQITVHAGPLAQHLHGKTRPGHLDGVCSIVMKLFNLIQPHFAAFGQKDYQQLLVIQAMVNQYKLPITISSIPTQRHHSGLAFSTRNRRLSQAAVTTEAPKLYEALQYCRRRFQTTDHTITPLTATTLNAELQGWLSQHSAFEVISIDIMDPHSLEPVTTVLPGTMIFVSANLEGVNLIDHIELH